MSALVGEEFDDDEVENFDADALAEASNLAVAEELSGTPEDVRRFQLLGFS
jgi:hypothetical protein